MALYRQCEVMRDRKLLHNCGKMTKNRVITSAWKEICVGTQIIMRILYDGQSGTGLSWTVLKR